MQYEHGTFMPPSIGHPSTVYAGELASLGHGHAMWIPEGPDDSSEVQLGDVGYISASGAFIFLFNVDGLAKDEVTNKTGMAIHLPEEACHYFDVRAMPDMIKTYKSYLNPGVVKSHTIVKTELGGKLGGSVLPFFKVYASKVYRNTEAFLQQQRRTLRLCIR